MQKQSNKKIISEWAVLFFLIFTHHLYSQTDDGTQVLKTRPGIYVEVFGYKSGQPDKGRIDIYVQIPYPEVKFVKEDERFVGHLEISVTLLMKEQQVWQKNQILDLSVNDFSQTSSNKYSNLKQFSTDIEPGNYELVLQVTDRESKKVSTLQKSLSVKDFNKDSLALSDIMIAYRMNKKGTQKEIIPNLSGVIGKEMSPVLLFFELYNRVDIDSVSLQCKFLNSKQEDVADYFNYELLTGGKKQIIWQIDTPALDADQYTIMIEVEGNSKLYPGMKLRAKTKRSCLVRMTDLPAAITNLDKAIDQLIYIASGSEIAFMKEAPTSEEKKKRFLGFWTKRDPDPKTPENELMEEYYSRIDYAQKNFSGLIEGWRTDMGMIFIKFGTPDNVERHPFDADNKPYEVWYYYNQNREFVFIDENGFGQYRLRYPTTDLEGRLR